MATTPTRAIERVLRGEASYAELDGAAQAVVRAGWDARIAEVIAAADLTEQLNAAGIPWSEAEADGTVVRRDPDSPPPAGTFEVET